jgi:cyclohexadienyl dehydratase
MSEWKLPSFSSPPDAVRALMQIDASSTLRRIQAAGVLRVGTTGDYTPFSLLQPDGSYAGADIDMAYDLAERLGIEIIFVPSVWIDLLDDFLADRFDIAMGGVTVTAPRAERAFFSIPTFVDGKRPLTRREDRGRFTTIAAIDQPGVRLIANPGSANEAFARANFKKATVIIHHDNASVFDELVAGRADVMITDGLEADHQARLHPELCAVPVAAPFTRLEKAYMFARDPAMKAYIDEWLKAAFASGQWQRALDRAMSH